MATRRLSALREGYSLNSRSAPRGLSFESSGGALDRARAQRDAQMRKNVESRVHDELENERKLRERLDAEERESVQAQLKRDAELSKNRAKESAKVRKSEAVAEVKGQQRGIEAKGDLLDRESSERGIRASRQNIEEARAKREYSRAKSEGDKLREMDRNEDETPEEIKYKKQLENAERNKMHYMQKDLEWQRKKAESELLLKAEKRKSEEEMDNARNMSESQVKRARKAKQTPFQSVESINARSAQGRNVEQEDAVKDEIVNQLDAEVRNEAKVADDDSLRLSALEASKEAEMADADFKAKEEQFAIPLEQKKNAIAQIEARNQQMLATPDGKQRMQVEVGGQVQQWHPDAYKQLQKAQQDYDKAVSTNQSALEQVDLARDAATEANNKARALNEETVNRAGAERKAQLDNIRSNPSLAEFADRMEEVDSDLHWKLADLDQIQDPTQREEAENKIRQEYETKQTALGEEIGAKLRFETEKGSEIYQDIKKRLPKYDLYRYGKEFSSGTKGSQSVKMTKDRALNGLKNLELGSDVTDKVASYVENFDASKDEPLENIQSSLESFGVPKKDASKLANELSLQNFDARSLDREIEHYAKQKGIPVESARKIFNSIAERDWSNAPTDEKARVLSDGEISVNPKLWIDPDKFRDAVNSTDAPKDVKKAMDSQADEFAAKAAEAILPTLNQTSDFKKWVKKEEQKDAKFKDLPEGKKAIQFLQSITPTQALVDQIEIAGMEAFYGLAQQAAGFISMDKYLGEGMIPAMEWATKGSKLTGEKKDALQVEEKSPEWTKAMGYTLGDFASTMGQSSPALLAGLGAGLVTRNPLAIVGTTSTVAGAQSAGGTFAEAYDKYRKQGLSSRDAADAARLPAIITGGITAAVTALGGQGGAEAITKLANPVIRRQIVASTMAKYKGAIPAALVESGKGLTEEILEESLDTALSGYVQALTYNKDLTPEEYFSSLKDAFVLGGATGGVMQGAVGLNSEMKNRKVVKTPSNITPEKWTSVLSEIKSYNPLQTEAIQPNGKPKAVNTPQDVERTKQAANALVLISQGELSDMTGAELHSIGIERNDKGELQNVKKMDDGNPPLVKLENGKPIITQVALDWLGTNMPEVRSVIGMDESTARATANAPEVTIETAEDGQASQDIATAPTAPESEAIETPQEVIAEVEPLQDADLPDAALVEPIAEDIALSENEITEPVDSEAISEPEPSDSSGPQDNWTYTFEDGETVSVPKSEAKTKAEAMEYVAERMGDRTEFVNESNLEDSSPPKKIAEPKSSGNDYINDIVVVSSKDSKSIKSGFEKLSNALEASGRQKEAKLMKIFERVTSSKLKGLSSLFSKVSFENGKYKDTGGMLYSDDTLIIDPTNMAESLSSLKSPEQMVRALNAVTNEEVTHSIVDKAIGDERVLDLWRSIPKSLQSSSIKTYERARLHALSEAGFDTDSIDVNALNKSFPELGRAHEFVRQVIQKDLFNEITEETYKNPSFGAKLVKLLNDFVDAITNLSKSIDNKEVREKLEQMKRDARTAAKQLGIAINGETTSNEVNIQGEANLSGTFEEQLDAIVDESAKLFPANNPVPSSAAKANEEGSPEEIQKLIDELKGEPLNDQELQWFIDEAVADPEFGDIFANPNYANQGLSAPVRRAYNVIGDEYRKHQAETISNDDTIKQAEAMIAKNKQAVIDRLLRIADENGTPVSADVAASQILTNEFFNRYLQTKNQADYDMFVKLGFADSAMASEQGRALQMRRDKVMTPMERVQNLMQNILAVNSKEIRSIHSNRLTDSEKAKKVKELTTQYKNLRVQGKAKEAFEVKAELDSVSDAVTQGDMVLQESKLKMDQLNEILEAQGLTLDDIFGRRAVIRHNFAGIITQKLGKSDAQTEGIIEAIIHGVPTKEIMNDFKVTKKQVMEVQSMLDPESDAILDAIEEALERGVSATQILASANRMAMASPEAAVGKDGLTKEQRRAEAKRIASMLIPTQKQRDSKKWKETKEKPSEKKERKAKKTPEQKEKEFNSKYVDNLIDSLEKELNQGIKPTPKKRNVKAIPALVESFRKDDKVDLVKGLEDAGFSTEKASKLKDLINQEKTLKASLKSPKTPKEKKVKESKKLMLVQKQAKALLRGLKNEGKPKQQIQNEVKDLKDKFLDDPSIDFENDAIALGVDPKDAKAIAIEVNKKREAEAAKEVEVLEPESFDSQLQKVIDRETKVKDKIKKEASDIAKLRDSFFDGKVADISAKFQELGGTKEVSDALAKVWQDKFDKIKATKDAKKIESLKKEAQAAVDRILKPKEKVARELKGLNKLKKDFLADPTINVEAEALKLGYPQDSAKSLADAFKVELDRHNSKVRVDRTKSFNDRAKAIVARSKNPKTEKQVDELAKLKSDYYKDQTIDFNARAKALNLDADVAKDLKKLYDDDISLRKAKSEATRSSQKLKRDQEKEAKSIERENNALDRYIDQVIDRSLNPKEKAQPKPHFEKDAAKLAIEEYTRNFRSDLVSKLEELGIPRDKAIQTRDALDRARRRREGIDFVDIAREYEGKEYLPFDPSDEMAALQIAQQFGAKRASWGDKFVELVINNYLGGIKTFVVNALGFVQLGGYRLSIEHFVDSIVNSFAKDPNSAQWEEAKYVLKGTAPSIIDAWTRWTKEASSNAKMAWKYEVDVTKRIYLGDNSETNSKLDSSRQAIGGKAGKVVRTPSRILAAQDAFFQTLIMRATVAKFAVRLGKNLGKSGDDLSKFISREIHMQGSASWEMAHKYSEEVAFKNKLKKIQEGGSYLEHAVSVLLDVCNTCWPLKLLFFPFIKTPYNIGKIGINMSVLGTFPMVYRTIRGVNYAVQLRHKKFSTGKNFIGDFIEGYETSSVKIKKETYSFHHQGMFVRDISNQIFAWSAFIGLVALAEGGDDDNEGWCLTGSRPGGAESMAQKDLQNRKDGGAYLLKHNGKPVLNYGRYEPLAITIGSMVDAIRIAKGGGTITSKAKRIAINQIEHFKDKPYLSGIGDLWSLFDTRSFGDDEVKQSEEDDYSKYKVFAARKLGGMLITNFVRSAVREYDDTLRNNKTANWKYFMIPYGGWADPLYDVYGREIKKGGNELEKNAAFRIAVPYSLETNVHPADIMLDNYAKMYPSRAYYPGRSTKGNFVYEVGKEEGGFPIKEEMSNPQKAAFDELSGILFSDYLLMKTTGSERKKWLNPERIDNPTYNDIQDYKKIRSKAREDAKKIILRPNWKVEVEKALKAIEIRDTQRDPMK